jgi:hypothetical protein
MTAIPAPEAPPSVQQLWLPFCFPSMNELLAARGRQWEERGHHRNGYAESKRQLQAIVAGRASRLRKICLPYTLRYEFHRPDRRGDPSGIRAGAEKIILDAIARPRKGVKGWPAAGIVHCDGFHCHRGDDCTFIFCGDPLYRGEEGVFLTIEEAAL